MNMRPAAAVSKYEINVAQTASAAAHTSMRQTASPRRPRLSDTNMNGYGGRTLSKGRSRGTPSAKPMRYDRAVPPTIAAGTRAGFMGKDYTPAHATAPARAARGAADRGRRMHRRLVPPAGLARRKRPRDRHHAVVRGRPARVRQHLPGLPQADRCRGGTAAAVA